MNISCCLQKFNWLTPETLNAFGFSKQQIQTSIGWHRQIANILLSINEKRDQKKALFIKYQIFIKKVPSKQLVSFAFAFSLAGCISFLLLVSFLLSLLL